MFRDMRTYAGRIGAGFRKVSRRIADVQTTVLLTALYYVLVVPTSAVRRVFAGKRETGWREWTYRSEGLEDARLQS